MAEGTSGPDVLKLAKDAGPQTVDLRFCDLPGLMQQFSIPVEEFTEEGFADGYGFDGSSIRGYQEIQESPGPRPGRGVHRLLPEGPHTGRALLRPRPDHRGDVLATPAGSRRRAELHLTQTGIADTSWGPECELHIFASIRFDQNQHERATTRSTRWRGRRSNRTRHRRGHGWDRAKTDRRAGRPIGIVCDDGSLGYPLRLADPHPIDRARKATGLRTNWLGQMRNVNGQQGAQRPRLGPRAGCCAGDVAGRSSRRQKVEWWLACFNWAPSRWDVSHPARAVDLEKTLGMCRRPHIGKTWECSWW
jgi:hypothetical protein